MDSHDICHKIVVESFLPTTTTTKEKTAQRFSFILNSENFDLFSSDDNQRQRSEMSLRFSFLNRKISAEIGTTTNIEMNFETSNQVYHKSLIRNVLITFLLLVPIKKFKNIVFYFMKVNFLFLSWNTIRLNNLNIKLTFSSHDNEIDKSKLLDNDIRIVVEFRSKRSHAYALIKDDLLGLKLHKRFTFKTEISYLTVLLVIT